jgi:ABC-2 type transport system permease protein
MSFKTQSLIARHTWRAVLRNRAVWGLFLLVGLVAGYAAWAGWITFRQQRDTQQHYQEEARRDWLGNPDKHPHRMAHYGHFAFRHRSPLSLFDTGMERFLGNAVFLEAHRQNTVNFSEASFSTGLMRFGELSVAMLLQVLLPLLIFFLGAGSVSADRENGTLRLLLSQGLSGADLIVGHSMGLFVVILTLYVPLLVLAGVLWLAAQQGVPSSDEVIRFGLIVLFYGLYLAFFCVVAVLVSAGSRTTKTALVSLIGIWLVTTMVLPRASQALGTYVYALPSKTQFQSAIQADISLEGDSHNPDDPHYRALKDSLLRAHSVASVEQLPFNYSGYVMAEGEKISAEIYNRHYQTLLDRFEQQNQFARAMAFLDPYLAIKNLSMALAGTDFSSYVDFQRQAETYRYALAQKMNDLQIRYISNKKPSPTDKGYVINRKYWQEIPDFTYRALPVVRVLQAEWVSIAAFAGWLILLLLLIQRTAHRLTAF